MALIWKPWWDSLVDSLPAPPAPFFFGRATGSYYPNQVSKLCSLQWKCGALTTGPSGNSHLLLFWYELLSAASEGTVSQENSQSWLPTPTSKPHCWETEVTKSYDLQENTGFLNSICRDTLNRSECFLLSKDVQGCWQWLSSCESKIGRHPNVHQQENEWMVIYSYNGMPLPIKNKLLHCITE